MSFDVRQCRNCGKLFQSYGNVICSECIDERDRCFLKVRDYIYAHPNSDIAEISKKTSVSEKIILDFLKEERLSLNTKGLLVCEKCGGPIKSGRFCDLCQHFYDEVLQANVNNKKGTPPASKEKVEKEKTKGSRSEAKSSKLYLDYKI